MPNYPDHVVYVWIDALTITLVPSATARLTTASSGNSWPADLHLIAKDILWFHTVYWPAMLFALDLPLPK